MLFQFQILQADQFPSSFNLRYFLIIPVILPPTQLLISFFLMFGDFSRFLHANDFLLNSVVVRGYIFET